MLDLKIIAEICAKMAFIWYDKAVIFFYFSDCAAAGTS